VYRSLSGLSKGLPRLRQCELSHGHSLRSLYSAMMTLEGSMYAGCYIRFHKFTLLHFLRVASKTNESERGQASEQAECYLSPCSREAQLHIETKACVYNDSSVKGDR
jgi:hypothetical protein